MNKFCRECGNEIKNSAMFCARCGKAIGNSSSHKIANTAISNEKIKIPNRKISNKLLCKLIVWPWIVTICLLFLPFAGDVSEVFLGTVGFIGGLMIIVFGIWGLIRLAKADHRIATIILVLTIIVIAFQKVEIISSLGEIALFISVIISLFELNKLPDNVLK
ncbi:MAG: hypothetical protein RLY66_433 [Candidatus Parcubacteria bacterium]|jgi:hypothetical protein